MGRLVLHWVDAMKLKCRLGFHKWVELGQNILLSDSVKQCADCWIGHQEVHFGSGSIRYTPEAMLEAWQTGRIKNPEAHLKIYGVWGP